MFCSANDCACRPDTAVVNASKIPMTLPLQLDPQLDERRVTTGGPSPRTSQQAPCHQVYRYISMTYAGGTVASRAGYADLPADIAGLERSASCNGGTTAPCERQV